MSQLQSLNDRFAGGGHVRFEAGPGGLTEAVMTTPAAEATVCLHGAHVCHYRPAGHDPVLFMSGSSRFETGEPIRGGVPICFPWFGPRGGDAEAPNHGIARLVEWAVESVEPAGPDAVRAVFRLASDGRFRDRFDHEFVLRHVVTVGPTLTMTLETHNPSDVPMTIEKALHTYLAVDDVRSIEVRGLEHTEYLDKVDGGRRKREGDGPATVTMETDRVYLATTKTCTIDDPVLGRRITIDKDGSETTVFWNPWIDKARAMEDFGDAEWPSMVCIETCAVGDHALSIDAGATARMTAVISVEKT